MKNTPFSSYFITIIITAILNINRCGKKNIKNAKKESPGLVLSFQSGARPLAFTQSFRLALKVSYVRFLAKLYCLGYPPSSKMLWTLPV
jgi:hypothetical protein